MNIYHHHFTAPCCNNGTEVAYDLEIRATHTIMVEDIQTTCVEAATLPKPYHENIADFLFARFGGEQIISAHHNGTDIETRRPLTALRSSTPQEPDDDAEWTVRKMLERRRFDAVSQGGAAEITVEEIDQALAGLQAKAPETGEN